jgi:RNA polymerase sigma factor (sigma-70 family)
MLTVYLRSLVRDEVAVDDLFQETMVVAWRRLDECDLDRPFGPWLRGIASRLVLAYYRRQKTAPVLLNETVLEIIDRQLEKVNLMAGDTWDDKVAALRGLRGAKITGFQTPKPGSFIVRYDVYGDRRSVEYPVAGNGSATFKFVSRQGTTTEIYTPRQRGGGGGTVRRHSEPPTTEDRPPPGR